MEKLTRFFSSLSEETVLLRFLRPLRNFTREVRRIVDREKTVTAVFAEMVGGQSIIIGSAEIYKVSSATGEFAIVVHENFRRKGVGTTLMYVSFYCAYRRGVTRIIAYTHENNIPMKRLAKRFNGRVVGMIDAELYTIEFDVREALKAGEQVLQHKGIKVKFHRGACRE